ncbi:MAG TPA: purine-nucleoside phosphorylase [Aggregatilineales bacterium]|nr:purine-nucleoside phosphorylase [Anaerolineales bacterium]HRE48526.1 purine-nucleoside phosphorylase [Aggregatilineales bacterium]
MSFDDYTLDDYRAAADYIRTQTHLTPTIAVILGSGLGSFADSLENAISIPFSDIPGYAYSEVIGHKNRVVIGTLAGKTILAQQGRIHFYEGWSMAHVAFPMRMMSLLGVETVVITNAAGGLNPSYAPGDLMLISDHINLLGLVGNNPLIGRNIDEFGTRFPELTVAYDKHLRQLARKVAIENGITLREGIYIGLSGPMFETPAEIRMLRLMGADAVGMSTVNEVTAARHAGMRILGFSGITNKTVDDPENPNVVNHEEVLDVGARKIVPNLLTLLRGVLLALPE